MMCLGVRLQTVKPGLFGAWHNGLHITLRFIGSRVSIEIRNPDSTIVVTRQAATVDCCADKVRETLVRDLPRWARMFWPEVQRREVMS